ncbi:MAG TPA: class I adenylate-forming enzyme family protein, partial [Solirubrobacterales bacterium]|nr:class I adenylate-forming enzyme family protein [Solirubrobacterales bacterium]
EGAFAYPENQRLTYRRADELANRCANAMLARGLERGDRVLLYCENSVEAYVAKIAIAKAGLVSAPINPMLAPDVVTHLIERVEPKFAIVDDELWPKIESAFGEAGLEPGVTIPIEGWTVPGTVEFSEFIADASAEEPEVEIHGDDIWEIIFTSGTTAMPKGSMVSHHYSYFGAYSFALTLTRGIRFECDLKLVAFLPLIYHIADQIFSLPAWLCGGTLIIGRKHDPAEIARALSDEQATALWSGSPAMLEELAKELEAAPELDASELKTAIFGWTAIPPELVDRLKRLTSPDLNVCEILGQTEAISCFRFWPDKWPEIFAEKAPAMNYVGVPNPLLASKVVDEEGNSLEGTVGEPGEVVYRSPVVTPGYYLDEDATREAFRDGWFHSGDVCMYDEEGLRIMVDRSKDMIKSGGENVSTLRVETILRSHPEILKAAVVGLPHERWGEAVTAIIVADEGGDPDPDEVMAFCRERLAGYESPKGVMVVDDLPETVGGKVLKYKLRVAHAGFYES